MGAVWRHGPMHDVLLDWASRGPVAVLHTLPGDLWGGSGIQADRWQATTRRPGGANTAWEITDRVLPRDLAGFTGVPVPVLEPDPESLGAWTRLLTSPGTTVELAPRQLTRLPPDATYEEIHRHTSVTPSGLEVLAYRPLHSTPSPAYADEYRGVLALAARHYPLVLTDLAVVHLDSTADVALELTDRLIVCCTATEHSVDAAVGVLDGLRELGWGALADDAVAVVNGLGGAKQPVPDSATHDRLRENCAAVVHIPFDPHLFERRMVDLARLKEHTADSYLDLAARVVAEPDHTA